MKNSNGTQAPAAALPLRQDAPDLPACDPPQKDIMTQTTGGKLTDLAIYQGMGFVANSALSVAVTYFLMSKEVVKNFITKTTVGAQRLFRNIAPERMIGRVVEIGFMLISGTILTGAMAPLVNKREQIAHWCNKKLHKDEDVLPHDKQKHGEPLTLEDKVEQELQKRINYAQTSKDLWKARWTSILLPIFGEAKLSAWNAKREQPKLNPKTQRMETKWSTDSLSWKAGQYLYDEVLSPEKTAKATNFLSRHGAGIEDIRRPDRNGHIPESYKLLKAAEEKHSHGLGQPINEDRMIIAEQTRLVGKEIGWTILTSEFMEWLTKKFHNMRIKKQERIAIAKMREEGIIPAGVHVETDRHGHVKLTKTKAYVPPAMVPEINLVPNRPEEDAATKQWADDKVASVEKTNAWAADKLKQLTTLPEKAANFAEAVEKQKQASQPSLTV